MADYELIGQKLGHSASKPIHEALGLYTYALHPLPDESAVADYLNGRNFKGCNVTIPYKQTVLPFLNEIDPKAARIGAVNTIVNRGGRLFGYNTDYDGLAYLLARKHINLAGQKVLLLGSGGTCKTAMAVAKDAGAASILVASRAPQKGQMDYAETQRQSDVDVLINVSPAGMYPNNGQSLVDLSAFKNLAAVADVVYNPLKTRLLLQAEALGIPAAGGLPMLVRQAAAAAELFTGEQFETSTTEDVLSATYGNLANLVLVGMPSCGKSHLGRRVAHRLHKQFVDLDEELVKKHGKSIPQIFEEGGEGLFRQMETEVLETFTKEQGQVLATGGGVVTQPHNLPLLRQNGVVVYVHRPLPLLQVGGGRPLSSGRDALERMYAERDPLYAKAADATVANDVAFEQVMDRIVEAYHAVIDTERAEY